MNPVSVIVEDLKELKKHIGSKLPKTVAKKMSKIW